MKYNSKSIFIGFTLPVKKHYSGLVALIKTSSRHIISQTLFFLGSMSLALGAPPIHIDAPRNYITGDIPDQVIPLDMDNDGDVDAAVKCTGISATAQLQLFENPGDGSLTPRATLAIPSSNTLVAADLNNDGRTDLAQVSTVTVLSSELHTWIQNTSFSFTEHVFSLPFSASHLATGNLDNLHAADMIIGDDTASPLIHVYLATAEGSYTLQGTYSTESTLRDVDQDGVADIQTPIRVLHCLCKDLDGDGDDDVAVVNSILRTTQTAGPFQTTDITTLVNQGGGILGPFQVVINTGGSMLEIEDMDGDTMRDIVTKSTSLTGPDMDDLLIFKNRGNGTFAAPDRYASGSSAEFFAGKVSVADVDLDGDLDVGIIHTGPLNGNTNDNQTDRWALFLNDGNGGLGNYQLFPTGADLLDLTFADLDGADGPEALSVAGDDNRLSVQYNLGGHYPTPTLISLDDPRYSAFGSTPADIVSGDFNNDGYNDLAVIAGYSRMIVGPDILAVLDGINGGISQVPAFTDLTEAGPTRLYADQITGSNAHDLSIAFAGETLYGDSPGLGLGLGSNAGLLTPLKFSSLNGMVSDLTSLDVDSDGTQDMAALRIRDAGLTAGISIVSTANDGTLTYLDDILLGSDDVLQGDTRLPEVICSPDMNGDGLRDLVAVTYNMLGTPQRKITVLLNHGDLSFTLVGEFTTVAREVTDIIGADITGNGLQDIIITTVAGLSDSNQDGSLEILPNLGGGILGTGISYNVGQAPVRLNAAHMDDNGGIDLIIANDGSNEATILFNDGNGNFTRQERYLTGGGTDGLVVTDIDQDGDIDIAICNDNHATNRHYGTVSLLLNRSGTTATTPAYLRFLNPIWMLLLNK